MIKKIICSVVIFIMCLGSIAGCTPKSSNIVATAMFSKNILELPIKGKQPNAPGQYYIDNTAEEIFSTISLDKSLSAEFVDGKIFISKDNNNATKDYFLIRKITAANGEIMYEFFDMGGLVKMDAVYQRILMPYHFISQEDGTEQPFNIGTEYKTKYNAEDFFDYYNGSGWYDIEKGIDYIIINGYNDKERVLALNNSLTVPLQHIEFGLPIKIQFNSSNEINVNVFTISVIT